MDFKAEAKTITWMRLVIIVLVSSFTLFAQFPENQIHPAVRLTPIQALSAKYLIMGISFLDDGRMLMGTSENTRWGDITPKTANDAMYVVSGLKGEMNEVTLAKVADNFYQPAGVLAVGNKGYISDRDGFYQIMDLNSSESLNGNRKKVISYPWDGDSDVTWSYLGTSWHQWVFTPMYFGGKFFAPYSGTITMGGHSSVPSTSPFSGAFLSWTGNEFEQPHSNLERVAGGLRSPNGGNVDSDGNLYFTDNQGSFVPSSTFSLIKKGRFYGHRQGGDSTPNWAETLPYENPTAWLPHGTVRSSPSQPIFLDRGLYKGDWLLGDVNNPGLVRIAIDRADGENEKQNGAVFFFTGGFGSEAINRMTWNKNKGENNIIIGTYGTMAGNWPNESSRGSVYKLDIKDSSDVFEMKAIRSLSDGLEIEFTQPVDKGSAIPENIQITQWSYSRGEAYGCCKNADDKKFVATSVSFSQDCKRVHLVVDGLKVGGIMTQIEFPKIKSAKGSENFYPTAWYTYNFKSTREFNPVGITNGYNLEKTTFSKSMTYQINGKILNVEVNVGGRDYTLKLVDLAGREISSVSQQNGVRASMSMPKRHGLYFIILNAMGQKHIERIVL